MFYYLLITNIFRSSREEVVIVLKIWLRFNCCNWENIHNGKEGEKIRLFSKRKGKMFFKQSFNPHAQVDIWMSKEVRRTKGKIGNNLISF